MATFSGAGTCLAVSAAAPATHNAAGFAALTWTTVGELESIGELTINHATVSFTNLCTARTSVSKGAEEPVTVAIGVAMDRDDAGQALMTTARKSLTAVYSFRIQEANGDIAYFRAHVMSERIAGGSGVNEIKMGAYSLGVKAAALAIDETVVVVNAV
jgi:hypothetical protein